MMGLLTAVCAILFAAVVALLIANNLIEKDIQLLAGDIGRLRNRILAVDAKTEALQRRCESVVNLEKAPVNPEKT